MWPRVLRLGVTTLSSPLSDEGGDQAGVQPLLDFLVVTVGQVGQGPAAAGLQHAAARTSLGHENS